MNISKRYLSNNHNKKPIKGNKASSQRSVRNIQSQVTIIKQQHVLKHKKPPGAIGHLAQSIEAKLCNSQLQVTTVKQQRVLQIGNSEDFAYEPRTLPWCSTEIDTQSHLREWKRTAPEDWIIGFASDKQIRKIRKYDPVMDETTPTQTVET